MTEFSAVLRRLMAERGMSLRELARRSHWNAGHLSKVANGRRRASPEVAASLDEVLGADGELAALVPVDTGRRAVLAGGMLAGGLLSIGPESRERIAWVMRQPPRIDGAAIGVLADVLADVRRADDVLGSAMMSEPVLAQLAAVERLVRQAHAPVRQALLNIAQQWAQFAGWLCRNTADLAGAHIRLAQALEWASELGDWTMISTILAEKSEMAAYAGEAGAAISLAQAAQRDTRAVPEQRALAAEFEARGHAMAGDAVAAERKLGEAENLAGEMAALPRDRRPWLYWMTAPYFPNQSGIACAYLAGDPRWHMRALTLLATVPGRDGFGVWAPAQNLTYLAFAHARAGEVDQACATGLAASGAVRQAGSARHAAVLADVHADLEARYPGDSRVAELAEALR
jgi:transcriptional regulator with XRE-family HTH domain